MSWRRRKGRRRRRGRRRGRRNRNKKPVTNVMGKLKAVLSEKSG
jgi:hypothetical protein